MWWLLSLVLAAPGPESPKAAAIGARIVKARAMQRVKAPAPEILAMTWVAGRRLLMLTPESVALVRLEAGRAAVESERPLPGSRVAVRAAGGLIGAASEDTVWVMTSRAPRAALFEVDGRTLRLRSEADAVPWPGASEGLRFRPSTNLIEGRLLGHAGPFVAAEPMSGAAVLVDGSLLWGAKAHADLRVGTALAALWPGWLIASSSRPPGEEDCLSVFETVGADLRLVETVTFAGSATAVAARLENQRAIVAVASASRGESDLVLIELLQTPSP